MSRPNRDIGGMVAILLAIVFLLVWACHLLGMPVTFTRHEGMHEDGYNRGAFIDSCNRYAGVPLGSPYCASCAALAMRQGAIYFATKKRASARAYITDEATQANRVWLRRVAIPVPSLAVWIRKGGGHIGYVSAVRGDTLICFEFNTSPNQRGSQWNGAWSGTKRRSIKRDCAPTNAYRITHFVPVSLPPTLSGGAVDTFNMMRSLHE